MRQGSRWTTVLNSNPLALWPVERVIRRFSLLNIEPSILRSSCVIRRPAFDNCEETFRFVLDDGFSFELLVRAREGDFVGAPLVDFFLALYI
jgi:hypothetical protein